MKDCVINDRFTNLFISIRRLRKEILKNCLNEGYFVEVEGQSGEVIHKELRCAENGDKGLLFSFH